MQSQDPNTFTHGLPVNHRQWIQSVQQVLNGSVDMGSPTSVDSTGQYNEFERGNTSGVLFRIGATGSIDNALAWPATGYLTLNHGLQRQPIGCHLVSSDKQLSIWQPEAPNATDIFLTPSDPTANATVYVF
jgi:hypothetical protein